VVTLGLKMIIESNRVYIENGNKPHGHGIIDPEDFSPYPQNPKIAKFFSSLGKLNMHNTFKRWYYGAKVIFLRALTNANALDPASHHASYHAR
jgi:hypothetical protein